MLSLTALPDRAWQAAALCRGNHSYLFFPPSTVERKDERERRETKAKAICMVCPVRGECLDGLEQEANGQLSLQQEIDQRHAVARKRDRPWRADPACQETYSAP